MNEASLENWINEETSLNIYDFPFLHLRKLWLVVTSVFMIDIIDNINIMDIFIYWILKDIMSNFFNFTNEREN